MRLVTTSAAQVEREAITWLWHGRIPAIGVTILAGDPGLGKSLLTVEIARRLGSGMFDGESGTTLLATAEDSWGAVVRPRLEAAAAPLQTVAFVGPSDDAAAPLTLPDDVPDLEARVAEHQAGLVVIDPLMAFLPDHVNSWRDQSVRRALAPLHHLAARQRCAVLCVVHLNKAMGADPLQRTGGSVGIPGAARSALLFARDPDDPDGERGKRRVLAQFKSNYGELVPSLRFEIESTTIPGDDSTTPRLRELGESPRAASALLSTLDGEARLERDEAADFLLAELANGRRPAKEIKAASRDAGISEITLRRAKAELGVKSEKEGLQGPWYWRLTEGDQGYISEGPPSKALTDPDHLIPFDGHRENGASPSEGDHLQGIETNGSVEVWDYT